MGVRYRPHSPNSAPIRPPDSSYCSSSLEHVTDPMLCSAPTLRSGRIHTPSATLRFISSSPSSFLILTPFPYTQPLNPPIPYLHQAKLAIFLPSPSFLPPFLPPSSLLSLTHPVQSNLERSLLPTTKHENVRFLSPALLRANSLMLCLCLYGFYLG